MTVKRKVETPKAPKPIGPYSQGIEAGGFVFVSGQLGIDPDTGQMAEGVEAQARQALKNLVGVLEAGGAGLEDVVKVTVFIRDMNQFSVVNAVYQEFFSPPYPARAVVEVSALPGGGLVEIECIAML